MYTTPSAYPLNCSWAFGLFLLVAMVNNAAVSTGVQGSESLLSVLQGKYPGWINLEIIVLSEASQSQKDEEQRIPLI